jgi:hypothetical protein
MEEGEMVAVRAAIASGVICVTSLRSSEIWNLLAYPLKVRRKEFIASGLWMIEKSGGTGISAQGRFLFGGR